MHSHTGELIALMTAVCWTVSVMSFERAGKRIGSLNVNLLRLFMACLFLTAFCKITTGSFLPFSIPFRNWRILILSGVIGFSLGDMFLFESFVRIGSRVSMLIMSLVPVITTILGWLFLGEILTRYQMLGMIITVTGISIVVFKPGLKKRFVLRHPIGGLLFALGGTLGQASGFVLSKIGMEDHNAFAATQIRVLSGFTGFLIIYLISGRWKGILQKLEDKRALLNTGLGAVFGPFLGVSLSLLALQFAYAGVVSTIIAIVPVLIIIPSVVLFREKILLQDIVGAVVAVGGVSLLFL